MLWQPAWMTHEHSYFSVWAKYFMHVGENKYTSDGVNHYYDIDSTDKWSDKQIISLSTRVPVCVKPVLRIKVSNLCSCSLSNPGGVCVCVLKWVLQWRGGGLAGPCLCRLPLLPLRTSRSSSSLSTDARNHTVVAPSLNSIQSFYYASVYSNDEPR